MAHAYRFFVRKKAHSKQPTANSRQHDLEAVSCKPQAVSQRSCKPLAVSRKLNKRKLTISLAIILIILTVFTQLAPQLANAATNSWGFGGDLSGYDYDGAKINIADSKASLTSPGSVNGANMNLSPKSGVTSDGAAQFTAANKDYLTIPSNASLQTGDIDFEVGAWVYMDTKTANQDIVSKWTVGGGSNNEYLLRYNTTTDRFDFYASSDGSVGSQVTANNFGAVSLSTWYFVRAWHDSVNNKLKIQVNNGTADSLDFSTGVLVSNSAFVLGGRADTTQSGFFNGRLDSAQQGILTPIILNLPGP